MSIRCWDHTGSLTDETPGKIVSLALERPGCPNATATGHPQREAAGSGCGEGPGILTSETFELAGCWRLLCDSTMDRKKSEMKLSSHV